jgi:hypothetical protein
MKALQILAALVILGALSYAGIVWKSCHSLPLAKVKSAIQTAPESDSVPVASPVAVESVSPTVNNTLYSELEQARLSGSAPDENTMFKWLLVSEPNAPRKEVEDMSEGSQKDVIVKAYEHAGVRLSQGRIKADQFKLHSFAHGGGQVPSYSR